MSLPLRRLTKGEGNPDVDKWTMLDVVQYLQSRINDRFGVYRSPLIRRKRDKGEKYRDPTRAGRQWMANICTVAKETARAWSTTNTMTGVRGTRTRLPKTRWSSRNEIFASLFVAYKDGETSGAAAMLE